MFEKLTATTLALVVAVPAAGFAFDAADWDTDGDGTVSPQEYSVAMTEWSDTAFTEADSNGDNMLSMDEIAAALENGTLPSDPDR